MVKVKWCNKMVTVPQDTGPCQPQLQVQLQVQLQLQLQVQLQLQLQLQLAFNRARAAQKKFKN